MNPVLPAFIALLMVAGPAAAIVPTEADGNTIGGMDHDHYALTDTDGDGLNAWRELDGVVRDAYGDLGKAPVNAAKDIEKAARNWLYQHGPTYGVMDASPDALELRGVRESLTGYHARFDQVVDGTDVIDAEVSVHILIDTEHVIAVHSRAVTETEKVADPLPATDAIAVAGSIAQGNVKDIRTVYVADGLTGVPAWEVEFSDDLPISNWFVHVSQKDGEVLKAYDTVTHATAQANVWINPIVESGIPQLRDNQHNFDDAIFDDEAYGLPDTALDGRDFTQYYREVTLDNLEEDESGQTILSGPWVKIYDEYYRSSTGPAPGVALPTSPDGDFRFNKGEPRFEGPISYYWIDQLQKDMQALGFVGGKGIADYQIPVAPYDQVGLLNAFCTCGGADGTSTLHFGYHAPVAHLYGNAPAPQGFADAGEDAEVVAHEYGHAVVHHQVLGYNSGTMHEGWADFYAAAMLEPYSGGNFDTCIAEWLTQFLDVRDDDYRKPTCLRDLNNDLEYYYGMPNSHSTGQVHSGALWAIRSEIGSHIADPLIFEGHYYEAKDGIPHQAAEGLLVADFALHDGEHFSVIMDEYTQHRNVTNLIVTEELRDAVIAHQEQQAVAAQAAAGYSALGITSMALIVGTSVVIGRRNK